MCVARIEHLCIYCLRGQYSPQKMDSTSHKPLIVGIGGSTRSGSTSERALCFALKAAEAAGARTVMFGGAFLGACQSMRPRWPNAPPSSANSLRPFAQRTESLCPRRLPRWRLRHGQERADLLEDLREDKRAISESRAVGCIVTAFGWQTCGTTLSALRSIVHALRGWPTPLGAALNASEGIFDAAGNCTDSKSASQLSIVGHQVAEFAQRFSVE